MAAKQKIVTINEKEYTLQHPGVRWYAQHVDRCTGKNGLSTERYMDGLLKNVVVQPQGLKLEDFDDDMAGFEELMSEIEMFLRGH